MGVGRRKGRRETRMTAAVLTPEQQALFDQLRTRVQRSARPRPAPPPGASMQDVVRQAIAQDRADREKAEQATQRARWLPPPGAACCYCGWAGRSGQAQRHGPPSPKWWDGPRGPYCGGCRDDRTPLGTVEVGDDEHRATVLTALLGDTGWRGTHLVRRSGFRWYYEDPGAAPSDQRRFGYVDLAGLRARLDERAEPVPEHRAEGCTWCGTTVSRGFGGYRGDGAIPGVICAGCLDLTDRFRHGWIADGIVSLLTGQPWRTGLAEAAGFTWFVRSGAAPSPSRWAHLDLVRLRTAARDAELPVAAEAPMYPLMTTLVNTGPPR